MIKEIAIYSDKGVDGKGLRMGLKSIARELPRSGYRLRLIDAEGVKKGSWQKWATGFVLLGGRDLLYLEHLGPEGAQQIRSFVENGGHYLGICAGAYFASQAIEFEKGGKLEVIGDRPLQFFPGVAKGPAYGNGRFVYENSSGAEAALLSPKVHCYFNGGCYFADAEQFENVEVLARYEEIDGNPAAIISCLVGKGRALLSGVHLEYSSQDVDNQRILPKLKKDEEKRRALLRECLKFR